MVKSTVTESIDKGIFPNHKQSSMKRKSLIALHVLVWFILMFKDVLLKFFDPNRKISYSFFIRMLIDFSYLLVAITAFYGSYFLVARFLIGKTKRIGLGIVNIITVLLLTILARYLVEFKFLKPIVGFDNYSVNPHFTWWWFILNAVFYYWSYVMYGLLYGFAENYFFQQQRERELLKSEIAFLRSQINPHFLFNSINDIYALTLTRPAEAPNALIKLSELLRYALYSSKTQLVPLTDEVNYLRSYIELENIGKNGKACVQTVFSGEEGNQYIAPMLLIPFVENALKHGVIQSPKHPVEVLLEVRLTE